MIGEYLERDQQARQLEHQSMAGKSLPWGLPDIGCQLESEHSREYPATDVTCFSLSAW